MADFPPTPTSFPVTPRNKVRRRPQRGRYDKATVYDILDTAIVAHIAYVLDGQPFCTPRASGARGTGCSGTDRPRAG